MSQLSILDDCHKIHYLNFFKNRTYNLITETHKRSKIYYVQLEEENFMSVHFNTFSMNNTKMKFTIYKYCFICIEDRNTATDTTTTSDRIYKE